MKEVVQVDGAYLNPRFPLLNLFLIVVESGEWNLKVVEGCCCCARKG
jgi:hypothetical protein